MFRVQPSVPHAEVPGHCVQSLDWDWTNWSLGGGSLVLNHVAWGRPFHLS